MNTKEIQLALQNSGFNPGSIDGMRGRRTICAIKAFQTKNHLVADGLVGPQTAELLFKGVNLEKAEEFEIPVTIPWAETAYSLMGTQEQPGRGSNEAIIGWAEDLEITSYNDDDIPWCGLFVAHCIGSQLPEEVLPSNPLGARQWEMFGHKVSPKLGSILVFWRGSVDGWKGHVGFYWAEDEEAYQVLGGNQSNAVTIARISKKRLLTARWPDTGLSIDSQIRIAASNGKIMSVNEA